MTEKRFKLAFEDFDGWAILDTTGEYSDDEDYIDWLSGQKAVDVLNHFAEENKLLKKGMIGVVDRYIKNVECNPPSSLRTYGKIKGALVNIREDLRSLIGDFE